MTVKNCWSYKQITSVTNKSLFSFLVAKWLQSATLRNIVCTMHPQYNYYKKLQKKYKKSRCSLKLFIFFLYFNEFVVCNIPEKIKIVTLSKIHWYKIIANKLLKFSHLFLLKISIFFLVFCLWKIVWTAGLLLYPLIQKKKRFFKRYNMRRTVQKI